MRNTVLDEIDNIPVNYKHIISKPSHYLYGNKSNQKCHFPQHGLPNA